MLDTKAFFDRVYLVPTSWALSTVEILFKKLPSDESDKLKWALINTGVNLKGERTLDLSESVTDC